MKTTSFVLSNVQRLPNNVNTGSRLPNISDVQTRKRRNMIGIHMIRNNRIATTNKSTKDKIIVYTICFYSKGFQG
jgi:hypothetical protein